MDHYKREDCRYCSSKDLTIFCDLGKHAPSNSFIKKEEIKSEKLFPLELSICNQCTLVQLQDVVSGENIFKDYHYLSSSSKALVKHFSEMANYISEKFNLKSNDLVIDIGCNDGIALNSYKIEGLNLLGIEPSNIANIAKNKGFNVIKSFFNNETSKRIVSKYGLAKVITATNVFAHVDDMHSFMEGIPNLLDIDGILIVEVSYLLDLIDNNLFDTVYHEHLCYLNLTAVIPFIERFGLEVFDLQRKEVGASGPSITFFIKKKDSEIAVSDIVVKTLQKESDWGVKKLEKFIKFDDNIKELKSNTLSLINNLKLEGNRIGGFGAPAKGNTLLTYYGLSSKHIEVIADNTKLKYGKFTPGSHIPIVNDNEFIALGFSYALLLSWNYKEFFLNNSEYIKQGGKFIVPFPKPSILP
jgi:hypothetical protein